MHPDLLNNPRIIRSAQELLSVVTATTPGATKPAAKSDAIRLVGVDLAWNCEKNASGVAIGRLDQGNLIVESASANVLGFAEIANVISNLDVVRGVAIDAPLIVRNKAGGRRCEQELSACYGSRWAGTHRTNLQTPWKCGVDLGRELKARGFSHLGANTRNWQIECYPHPAIIEIFGLPKRLKYKHKKGMSTDDVRRGQGKLAALLASLSDSDVLPLKFADSVLPRLDAHYIAGLAGAQLKLNEDLLDSIVCVYIAGLYQLRVNSRVFGDVDSGYIYVPTPRTD